MDSKIIKSYQRTELENSSQVLPEISIFIYFTLPKKTPYKRVTKDNEQEVTTKEGQGFRRDF